MDIIRSGVAAAEKAAKKMGFATGRETLSAAESVAYNSRRDSVLAQRALGKDIRIAQRPGDKPINQFRGPVPESMYTRQASNPFANPPSSIGEIRGKYQTDGLYTAGAGVSGIFDGLKNGSSQKMFAEVGSNFRKTSAAFGNSVVDGILTGSSAGGFRAGAFATLGGAVGGGAFFALGNTVAPNNFEYEGMTKPIVKGAFMGAALGLIHKGGGAMMKTYGHAPNSAHYNFGKKMQSVSSSPLTKVALGAAAFAGAGETHLTKSISGQGNY